MGFDIDLIGSKVRLSRLFGGGLALILFEQVDKADHLRGMIEIAGLGIFVLIACLRDNDDLSVGSLLGIGDRLCLN